MIHLEQLADGSVSDRNFQKLMSLVPDTGGLSIRVRAGAVSSTGTVISGTGFTVVRNATGDYSVTVGFTQTPIVVVGAGATAAAYTTKLHATTPPTATGFRVACLTSAGALIDGSFHWVAIG